MTYFRSIGLTSLFLLVSVLLSCGGSKIAEKAELRRLLNIPEHFPLPSIPKYNKPTPAKIELGRHLFYDKRLSANQTQSCSSCHLQKLAFSDGVATPLGSTGHKLVRNSQGLGNTAYHATLTWANKQFLEIEDQLQVPIRADNPIELGVTPKHVDEVLARFDSDPLYNQLFTAAFPESESGASINKIVHALASFTRTLISGNSAYDRYLLGDKAALTEQQLLGFRLFNGEQFECFHCHGGINFSSSYRDANSHPGVQTYPFFNNGLYNINNNADYPKEDQGLFDQTMNPNHRGFFRPPSLRNIALTAPYMHDGSIESLRGVLEHYLAGGQLITDGPHAGDGRLNPYKAGFVREFTATEEEIAALIAFLESLTDEAFVTNPAHSNPLK